jgi:hypothetical protein
MEAGERGHPKPRINLLSSVRDLLDSVRVIRAGEDRQMDRIDRLEENLVELIKAMGAAVRSNGPEDDAAGPIAYLLVVRRLPNGSADVQIDGGVFFRLSCRLADCLIYLSSEDGTTDDALVPWKTRDDLVAWLTEKTNRQIPRRYINNLIHLLRATFRRAGLNPQLMQTNKKGVRFALRSRRNKGEPR